MDYLKLFEIVNNNIFVTTAKQHGEKEKAKGGEIRR